MTKINSRLRSTIKCFISQYIVFALVLSFVVPMRVAAQDYHPVHATVQVLPPYSLYLSDYSNGFRDRLVVTLYNRDLQQQTLDCRLRLRISNTSGFCIESRDEVPQRSITVEPNVPLRLTSQDIAPYLQTGNKAHLKEVFNKEINGVEDFIETLNEDDQFVKIFSLEDIQ